MDEALSPLGKKFTDLLIVTSLIDGYMLIVSINDIVTSSLLITVFSSLFHKSDYFNMVNYEQLTLALSIVFLIRVLTTWLVIHIYCLLSCCNWLAIWEVG